MSNFTRFFIDRPIFASVLSIVIVMVGAISAISLPVAQYPEIAPPTIVVSATYPGADAKVLSETVAATIEQEINGVEDMLYMSSQSSANGSLSLTITFKPGTNLDKSQVLVQNRLALAEPRLPQEVVRQGISVKKRSPDLSLVVNLVSKNKSHDSIFLSNYALLHVKDALSRVQGVGDISMFGARDYSMRIWLNPDRIAALGMTALDVVQAVREQNVQVTAGMVGQPPIDDKTAFQYTMTAQGRLTTVGEFEQIVVKQGTDRQIVRLKDIARVEIGARDYSSELYLDGQPSIGLAIFQLPGSNAVNTKKAVEETMEKLKGHFPEGMEYKIVYDTVVFVQESINAVVHTLIEALVLVVLVVILFLQNWRAAMIPLLAVPVSLVGTFAAMSALGLSLNTLSLFGLVLAIGIVVDDAIVVVENVERHIADGMKAREATIVAMQEVIGPIVATALVLVAVFAPTAFIVGVSGAFYKQFALTIAVSTVISAFNSLTLSPALCALLLDKAHTEKTSVFFGWFNRGLNALGSGYGKVVQKSVRFSVFVLLIYAGLNGLNYFVFQNVPVGFIPDQDQGYLIVNVQLPDAASIPRTKEVVAKVNEVLMHTEGVGHVNEYIGFSMLSGTSQPNVATLFPRLTSFSERQGRPELSAQSMAKSLMQKLGGIPEAKILVLSPPPIRGLSSVGGFKLQIQDKNNAGMDALQSVLTEMMAKSNQDPGLTGVFSTFRAYTPQLYTDIDRLKAKAMNIPLQNIYDALQIYLGSTYINDFQAFGRSFRVTAQADHEFRRDSTALSHLKTRNQAGDMIPLDSIVSVRDGAGPDKITRYNMYPAAELSGSTKPGYGSSYAISAMTSLLNSELPEGFGFEWTEITLQQVLAGNVSYWVFPLSVIFVFMALAAQYESWSLPFAVIMIVPMCILSALSGVWIQGLDNNILTQIGLIVLVGLSCKNAILIVEFAKRKREQGMDIAKSAQEAARIRLRPILMTSIAFIMGVFPLVTSQGAGAEARRVLGTAVFSGMIGVTILGLLFTPVFFVVIQKLSEKSKDRN